MIEGKISLSDAFAILGDKDSYTWRSGFSHRWELRDDGRVTLHANLIWDPEARTLTGDVVEVLNSDSNTLLFFEAFLDGEGDESPSFDMTGEDDTDESVETPRALLHAFRRQVRMMISVAA